MSDDPNKGFVDPKRGITLPLISFCVWLLASIFYQMVSAFIKINYGIFNLFASFILSIFAGWIVCRILFNRADKTVFAIAIVLNVLLIYSAANGVQSAYSANADANPPKPNKPVQQNGFLIPFIDPRPWLQDAYSKQQISELESKNDSLQRENEKLNNQTNYDPSIDTLLSKQNFYSLQKR